MSHLTNTNDKDVIKTSRLTTLLPGWSLAPIQFKCSADTNLSKWKIIKVYRNSINEHPLLKHNSTTDLLTQTETRNSQSACLKHSKTKSNSFNRGRQGPDDPRL